MTAASAQGVVFLPFRLNVCAVGDRVEPLRANIDGASVTISVPISMSEGAIGKSIYPDGWAWWVVDRLYVEVEASLADLGVEESMDERDIRSSLLGAAQTAVRRALNAYRWRLHQPEVHAVQIDPAQFTFALLHADGSSEPLPESVESFFFHRTPTQPPLTTSLNAQTYGLLQSDIALGTEPPLDEMIALDLEWLRSIGERARAREIATMCRLPEASDGGDDYAQP